MKLNMSLKSNYSEIILSDLKDIIIKLDGYRDDTDAALIYLKKTALTEETYCLNQVSLTLGNAVEILKEIRRNYYAASEISNKDMG